MIVKVQLSLATTHQEQQVLIYDKHRSLYIDGPVSEFQGIPEKMGNDKKAFFEVDILPAAVVLGTKLPDQGW